jgi:hypothetical protein
MLIVQISPDWRGPSFTSVSLTAIGSNLEVRCNNWERRIVKRRFVAESRRCILRASKFALAVRRHGMRVVVLGIMLA